MRRRRNGQALAEFALVAPIFFLLLFGIIEGGRFILYYETLNNATQEGARYAIVHGSRSSCPSGPMERPIPPPPCYDPTGAKVIQRVKDTAFGLLGTSVTVTPTWATDNARDSDVTVTATYTYNTLVPLIPLPPISITAESTLVINH
jgi:Flp pilus assembly protein TadG